MTTHKFGKCKVKVWKTNGPYYKSFPWRFLVVDKNGQEHKYVGIPNYCSTKHSALMRGWWRAKWFNEGTTNKHYK